MATIMICDRCGEKMERSSRGSFILPGAISSDAVKEMDLCDGCIAAVRRLVTEPPPKQAPLQDKLPKCDICRRYNCDTCHGPTERCGCARDGREG
jgi:hypothetical protein